MYGNLFIFAPATPSTRASSKHPLQRAVTIRDPHYHHHSHHHHHHHHGEGGASSSVAASPSSHPGLLRAQSVRARDDFGRTEIDTLARAFRRAHFSDVKVRGKEVVIVLSIKYFKWWLQLMKRKGKGYTVSGQKNVRSK